MPMVIIIAVIVGLAIGYAIAAVYQKKPHLSPDISPQTPPEPQDESYLDDKMWYEAELNLLFKFSEQLSVFAAITLKNHTVAATQSLSQTILEKRWHKGKF